MILWRLLPVAAAAAAAVFSEADRTAFRRDGYHIARGMFAAEAPALMAEMRRLMDAADASDAAEWDGNGASKYTVSYQPDAATGAPIPGRIFKIQGIGLRSAATVAFLRDARLTSLAADLLDLRDDEALDAFGTKFFPLLPVHETANGTHTRSTSTAWHDDAHFFGTTSPRVLSMSLYLEDTDVETGCLQVVPGSHATYGDGADRETRYARGAKEAAHGEWVELDDAESPADVVVPAGTPVFFDSRLLHGARHNTSPDRSSFRLIAHFVPADLALGWRGVDFGRGYADRYEVRTTIHRVEL